MEKRNLKNSHRLHRRIALSALRSWLVVIAVVVAAVSVYLDTRTIPHVEPVPGDWIADQVAQPFHRPRLPLGPYTVLLSAIVGLVLSGNGQPALELTTLGSVPSTDEQDYPDRLVVCKSPDSPVAETYRVLHQNLRPEATDYPLHRLMITSSFPLDGKSAIAANLATLIAQSGKRVVLVDADVQHPTQHCIFELDNHAGLADALREDTDPNEFLQNLSVHNLGILPSGRLTASAREMLDSNRMKGVIDALQQQADVVIVDSPPIAALADAKMTAAQLGATLLVIESAEGYYYYRYYSEHGSGKAPLIKGLPVHPFDQLNKTAESMPGEGAGSLVQAPTLDTRQFDQPPDIDLLRARVNVAVRRFRMRSALSVVLLVILALVILTIVLVSSLSRQQSGRINPEATQAAVMALTSSVDTAQANQTATVIASDSTRQLTESARTQTAAAATQQPMIVNGQTPGQVECDINIEILESPTQTEIVTAAITNIELAWRVRNRATSSACEWGQAGQETRLLSAVEVGGELDVQVLVQLTWIQGSDYRLALKVPLTVGQHNLVWKLIPPGARLPRGPDLLAKVVVVTPTATPAPTARLAPTVCPVEFYVCNCRQQCDPRGGCERVCDICSRPNCD